MKSNELKKLFSLGEYDYYVKKTNKNSYYYKAKTRGKRIQNLERIKAHEFWEAMAIYDDQKAKPIEEEHNQDATDQVDHDPIDHKEEEDY